MPQISAGCGIKIYIYFEDHPPPHFHAIGGGYEVIVEISSGRVLKGSAPRTELMRIINWGIENGIGLADNWQNAQTGEALKALPRIT